MMFMRLPLLFTLLSACLPLLAEQNLQFLQYPAGFSISIWAEDVPNARSMTLGDNGTVFVGSRTFGHVYALKDSNADGKADKQWTLATGLDMPNGVAYRDGALYIAESGKISRLDAIESRLDNPPDSVEVLELMRYRHHGWRYIAFGPDDKLYISLGAPCNVCDPGKLGTIVRVNADGNDLQIYAHGVRNSVGFDWNPQDNSLWFTDNGRDWLGDDSPPCELNHATSSGQHFGFPYCHGSDVSDPEFGKLKSCDKFVPPARNLGAHVAPLGVHFYRGSMFPAEYRNQIFIAEHGSWNRSEPIGYRLTLVKLNKNGAARSYEPFIKGWLGENGRIEGRPVALLELPDGSMLISDDHAGRIYRLAYSEPGE
jgi:glucose/arabinose dehydrogenase